MPQTPSLVQWLFNVIRQLRVCQRSLTLVKTLLFVLDITIPFRRFIWRQTQCGRDTNSSSIISTDSIAWPSSHPAVQVHGSYPPTVSSSSLEYLSCDAMEEDQPMPPSRSDSQDGSLRDALPAGHLENELPQMEPPVIPITTAWIDRYHRDIYVYFVRYPS